MSNARFLCPLYGERILLAPMFDTFNVTTLNYMQSELHGHKRERAIPIELHANAKKKMSERAERLWYDASVAICHMPCTLNGINLYIYAYLLRKYHSDAG